MLILRGRVAGAVGAVRKSKKAKRSRAPCAGAAGVAARRWACQRDAESHEPTASARARRGRRSGRRRVRQVRRDGVDIDNRVWLEEPFSPEPVGADTKASASPSRTCTRGASGALVSVGSSRGAVSAAAGARRGHGPQPWYWQHPGGHEASSAWSASSSIGAVRPFRSQAGTAGSIGCTAGPSACTGSGATDCCAAGTKA